MISTQNTHTHTLHDVFDDVGVAAAETDTQKKFRGEGFFHVVPSLTEI